MRERRVVPAFFLYRSLLGCG